LCTTKPASARRNRDVPAGSAFHPLGKRQQRGIVLIAWEHKVLPSLIGHVPGAPAVPAAWPDERFDMVWILERAEGRWSFSQRPQLLLAGDRAEPIR